MAIQVLLVDDSPVIRFKYQKLLAGADMVVDTAVDGHGALEALSPGHPYHLVISDLRMPGMDGHALVKVMRETPRLKTLPVLMLTGSDNEADLVELFAVGATDYVVKGGGAAELLARVQNLARLSMLQRELEMASLTDPLTGLANRRAGVERIVEEMSRAERYGHGLSVVLLDIDHFKRINDSHGHQGGDEILVHVAGALASTSRETDCVIRWGGEEFLFVFPETTLDDAAGIVDRFRAHLADGPVPTTVGGGTDVPVTISGGVAAYLRGDTLETLVDRADTALYEAKDRGRNRLLMAEGDEMRPVGTR